MRRARCWRAARGGFERPAVLIGKDTRISGYMLEAALEAGFAAAGVDVLLCGPDADAGAWPTSRARCACSAGVVISASHNPYADNGIKFFSARRQQAARRGGARDRGARSRQPMGCRASAEARPRAAHRRRAGPLHRILQEHLPQRARPARPEDRGRLRARRGLSRRAARVPRTRRGRGRDRRQAGRPQHQRRRRRHRTPAACTRAVQPASGRPRHRAGRRRRPPADGRRATAAPTTATSCST